MLRSIVKGTFVSTQVLNKFMDILLKYKKKKMFEMSLISWDIVKEKISHD